VLDLNNPSTQFLISASIAFLALLAAIFVPIFIYRKQRDRKGISYRIFYDTIVFRSQKSEITYNERKGIEIRYVTYKDASKKEKIEEIPVEENVYLVELKIWNSGDRPIKEEDFLDEKMKLIEIDFGQDARVLDIQGFWTNPENIKVEIGDPKIDKNIISFQRPPYLIQGSSMSVRVLLTKYKFENLKLNIPPIDGKLTENYDKTLYGRITNSPLFAYGFFAYIILLNVLITIAILSVIFGVLIFIFYQSHQIFYQSIPDWLFASITLILGFLIFFASLIYITPPISKLIQRKTPNISWPRVWENINKRE